MARVNVSALDWTISGSFWTHYQFQLARGPSCKRRYTADQVDFFVCCALDTHRFWVLPFEAVTVVTLKIYNGTDSKFHRYEDAWVLLEK